VSEHRKFLASLSADELALLEAAKKVEAAALHHDEALAEYYAAWIELEHVRQRFDMIVKLCH